MPETRKSEHESPQQLFDQGEGHNAHIPYLRGMHYALYQNSFGCKQNTNQPEKIHCIRKTRLTCENTIT